MLFQALLVPSARGAASSLVLLFDKRCPDCRLCERRPRVRRDDAVLSMLSRQGERFYVLDRWHATYGAREGSKQCLGDARTPEGLYYTRYVNEYHERHPRYGYVSIVLDYPNEEDQRNGGVDACGDVCSSRGALVALHGGVASPTRGCVRLLDSEVGPDGFHFRSIKRLADLVRSVPDEHIPVLSVPIAAPGCYAEVGHAISAVCAHALTQVLDARIHPPRATVSTLLAAAGDFTIEERQAQTAAAPPPSRSAATASPLFAVPKVGVWATSEAPICGEKRDQPCRPGHLVDGKPDSVWCESADGPGEGEWLMLSMDRPRRIVRIDIKNGNWQGGRYSLDWVRNGRVAALDIEVDGKVTHCASANAEPAELSCPLPPSSRGRQVLVRIAKAVRGELQDHTCLSELTLLSNEP